MSKNMENKNTKWDRFVELDKTQAAKDVEVWQKDFEARSAVLQGVEEWKRDMKEKLNLKDTTNDRLGRIEKAISEITGANKVEAIYEYANGLKNNPCSWAGIHYQRDLLPKHLQLIIGQNLYCEMLCGIIQEWAELKGYGHSESKDGATKG